MTILLSAGGTGGHIVPLLAVAHELKLRNSSLSIHVISEKGGKFSSLLQQSKDIDRVHFVQAGKFRRHYDESVFQRLLDGKTNFLNIVDFLKCLVGYVQSLYLVWRIKPAVMFSKGGFVVVPVGLAAATHKVPIVTHDSDTLPGLANRILARWVSIHATGMPKKYYDYPPASTRYVGVPIGTNFKPVSAANRADIKTKLGLPSGVHMVLVTGGSQGSRRLNKAVAGVVDDLLSDNPNLYIIHQVGKGRVGDYLGYAHRRLQIFEFLQGMHAYSAAADIVVTQASATTLVELASQKKAVISLPSPHLAGGHQLKNAKHLEEHKAAVIIKPTQPELLGRELHKSLTRLLGSDTERQGLGNRLYKSSKLDASHALAGIILEVANNEIKTQKK